MHTIMKSKNEYIIIETKIFDENGKVIKIIKRKRVKNGERKIKNNLQKD